MMRKTKTAPVKLSVVTLNKVRALAARERRLVSQQLEILIERALALELRAES